MAPILSHPQYVKGKTRKTIASRHKLPVVSIVWSVVYFFFNKKHQLQILDMNINHVITLKGQQQSITGDDADNKHYTWFQEMKYKTYHYWPQLTCSKFFWTLFQNNFPLVSWVSLILIKYIKYI